MPESHIHYARLDCANCNSFIGWLRSPDKIKGYNRINKHSVKEVCEFHGYDDEFCFICLRKKEELGKRETLTVDHIKELKNEGEGGDVIQNKQVLCSACHKLKNWARLYMNWHFKDD